MTRRTGPDQATRDAVYARDGYRCVKCSGGDVFAVHHRLPRGRGGDNRLSNLVLLCEFGGCHDTGVESKRAEAYEAGHLVTQQQTPVDVPLVRHGEWVRLTDDGSVEAVA